MADEIKVLDGNGNGEYRVLFYFPIATPKTYTRGDGTTAKVVPTPVPADGLIEAVLSLAEKTALDGGDAAWVSVNYYPDPALVDADHAAKLKEMYQAEKTRLSAWYQSRYKHLGKEISV